MTWPLFATGDSSEVSRDLWLFPKCIMRAFDGAFRCRRTRRKLPQHPSRISLVLLPKRTVETALAGGRFFGCPPSSQVCNQFSTSILYAIGQIALDFRFQGDACAPVQFIIVTSGNP